MTDAVTKSELIERVAKRVELSKPKAKKTIDELTAIIIEQLTKQDARKVSIRGFGTFETRHRSARKGVDPRDPGREITISARTVPVFRPGETLKRNVREAHSDGDP